MDRQRGSDGAGQLRSKGIEQREQPRRPGHHRPPGPGKQRRAVSRGTRRPLLRTGRPPQGVRLESEHSGGICQTSRRLGPARPPRRRRSRTTGRQHAKAGRIDQRIPIGLACSHSWQIEPLPSALVLVVALLAASNRWWQGRTMAGTHGSFFVGGRGHLTSEDLFAGKCKREHPV